MVIVQSSPQCVALTETQTQHVLLSIIVITQTQHLKFILNLNLICNAEVCHLSVFKIFSHKNDLELVFDSMTSHVLKMSNKNIKIKKIMTIINIYTYMELS